MFQTEIDHPTRTNDSARHEPITITQVQQKVLDFHTKMNRIAAFLRENNADHDLQIDLDKFYLEFYIDKAGLDRLVNISDQDGFAKMGVFFALEDTVTQHPLDEDSSGFGRLNCCFVGLDDDQKVLDVHFPGTLGSTALVAAENTWPPPGPLTPPLQGDNILTLATDTSFVAEYFEQ